MNKFIIFLKIIFVIFHPFAQKPSVDEFVPNLVYGVLLWVYCAAFFVDRSRGINFVGGGGVEICLFH